MISNAKMFTSWIKVFILFCTLRIINAVTLKCYSSSICNAKAVTLNHVEELIGTPYLDVSRPTVIYAAGFLGKEDGPHTKTILDALLYVGGSNICFLNWEEEAKDGILVPNYAVVVLNSIEIGKALGQALLKLSQCGLSLETLWLIGLSLGAHLMGVAGREIKSAGCEVGRITGCDPAYLGFDEPLSLEKALNKNCAAFVDIIHTTDIKYGMVSPTGDIDFYPNRGYYKKHGVQPGCPVGLFVLFSEPDICSHTRALDYLAAGILSPKGFVASKAANYKQWMANNGASNYNTYLGNLTNREYCGKYYLTTNASPPYGKRKDGLRP